MRKLSFDEISDWEEFEELVASFFRLQVDDPENSILSVNVLSSGKGSDGGKDILVNILVDDSIRPFERTWVIQCKFYENDVKKSDLSNVNIPSLIHQHKADGYLLVCKKGVVNTLATFFEELNKNCRFGYAYLFWSGDEFKEKILIADNVILQQFFPEYYSDYERRKNFMKAFISYSINDSEQYVLVLLSEKLREKGFTLVSNPGHGNSRINPFAAMRISGASLFIGVVTANGLNHGKVFAEHHLAVSKFVPALLLVEDTAQLSPDFTNSNVVFFNRQNPQIAIEHINKNIRQVGRKPINGQQSPNNAAAWVLGGLALIGLVSLLSSND